MIGILCEKPSAARNFEKALGGMSGSYNGEQFVIVNARGHLYEFKDPCEMVSSAKHDQYKSWNPEYLPWDETDFQWEKVPLKVKGVSSLLAGLKKILSGVDEIAIATDLDPSGEGFLLGWEVIEGLGLQRKKITRIEFMDESEKEIRKGFTNRKDVPDYRKYHEFMKADYRSKWDLLSMQWTRIATSCVGGKAVLRQGRLKSVMIRLVGDQLKLVQDYVEKPYYYPSFVDDHGVVYREKDYEKKSVPVKSDDIIANLHSSTVDKDKTERKAQIPPRLIDLAALSSRLAPKGFKAKVVLDTYQKMYEAKVVSYPRTEDKEITPEQFNDLLPLAGKIASVVGVNPALLTHTAQRSSHVKTGGAHGANRPGPAVPSSMDDIRKTYGACGAAIYEILAKSYLAMLAEDYIYDVQSGHVHDFPTYLGSVSVPVSRGWKDVFSEDDDAAEDVNDAGLGSKADPKVAEGKNKKPPHPTMKWLMKQLEKYDVGTGATRTSTYSDVTNESTKYPLLIDKKGKILMSPFGDMSYILLKDTIIGNPEMTQKVFREMAEIAKGTMKAEDGLHCVQDYIRQDRKTMAANVPELKKGVKFMSDVVKEKYSGTFVNGETISFSREWRGHRFTDDECEKLLKGQTLVVRDLVSKKNPDKTYAMQGKLTHQTYKGHEFWGFEGEFLNEFPESLLGHKFTEDEQILLEGGKEVYIEGMEGKRGPFNAYVRYGDTVDKRTGKPTVGFEFRFD